MINVVLTYSSRKSDFTLNCQIAGTVLNVGKNNSKNEQNFNVKRVFIKKRRNVNEPLTHKQI